MKEKIESEPLSQREYQKKYDKKTKMISVKYVLSDMDDYEKLMNFLERTEQSANGFIKGLIKDFLEHKYVITEKKIAEYYKDYCVSGELLNKLKNVVGVDRYNLIMDYYMDSIETELYDTFADKGDAFDEWIEQFIEDIDCGDIDINVSEKEFVSIVDKSISENMGYIYYN